MIKPTTEKATSLAKCETTLEVYEAGYTQLILCSKCRQVNWFHESMKEDKYLRCACGYLYRVTMQHTKTVTHPTRFLFWKHPSETIEFSMPIAYSVIHEPLIDPDVEEDKKIQEYLSNNP